MNKDNSIFFKMKNISVAKMKRNTVVAERWSEGTSKQAVVAYFVVSRIFLKELTGAVPEHSQESLRFDTWGTRIWTSSATNCMGVKLGRWHWGRTVG
jgi:hypothetical protein